MVGDHQSAARVGQSDLASTQQGTPHSPTPVRGSDGERDNPSLLFRAGELSEGEADGPKPSSGRESHNAIFR